MQLSMKVSFTVLTIVATGLFILATSCQQANKGESKSKWQLQSPPGSAAGYGTTPLEPLDTGTPKEPASTPQSRDNGHEEIIPAASAPASRQPATESDRPHSSTPALKIEPPPSTAGYGSPFPDTGKRKETPPVSPTNASGAGEAGPAKKEPAPRQPTKESDGSGPPISSWKIEPPPSAAGYGK